MIDFMLNVDETFSKSSLKHFATFLNNYPSGSWYLISDYCFDENKINDVITFTVLLHHDKLNRIMAFIKQHAPKDIKNTRTANATFIQYINSQVAFHFSILLSKDDDILKTVLTKEIMQGYLEFLIERIPQMDVPAGDLSNIVDYEKRARQFLRDFQRKAFNLRLARRILLTSCLNGLITYHLYCTNKPTAWSWISDRDAIIDKYDGFALDNAYLSFCFFTLIMSESGKVDLHKLGLVENNRLRIPKIAHVDRGIDTLDALIRIPDYLAGSLAAYDPVARSLSKEKFETVFFNSFFDVEKHAILQLVADENKTGYCTRRVTFA